jgi:hypothetical protein
MENFKGNKKFGSDIIGLTNNRSIHMLSEPLFHQKKQSYRYDSGIGLSAKGSKERARRQIGLNEALKICQDKNTASISYNMKMLSLDETLNNKGKITKGKTVPKVFTRSVLCRDEAAAHHLDGKGTLKDMRIHLGIAIRYSHKTKSFTLAGDNNDNLDRGVHRLQRELKVFGSHLPECKKTIKSAKPSGSVKNKKRSQRKTKAKTVRLAGSEKDCDTVFAKGGETIERIKKEVAARSVHVYRDGRAQEIVLKIHHPEVVDKLQQKVETIVGKKGSEPAAK